jgi:GR25 family glycosyltransferase involved in LPS biosynthesis
MKLLDFVDKIYYINLPNRSDKNEAILEHFKLLGLESKVTRLIATSPTDLGYVRGLDNKFTNLQSNIAFSHSHMRVVKSAFDEGLENILVFEDDGRIYSEDPSNPLQHIEAAIDQIKDIPNWDILFLGATIGGDRLKMVGPNLIKVDVTVCSHAYILNRKTFSKLLDCNPTQYYDCALSTYLREKYVVYPLAAEQVFINSTDIGESNHTPGISFWKAQLEKPIDILYSRRN